MTCWTDILRSEWGYTGMVMTDWGDNSLASHEVKAGNNVKMSSGDTNNIIDALTSGYLTRDDLERNAKDVLNMIMKTRIFQRQALSSISTDVSYTSATQIKATNYTWCSEGGGVEACQYTDGETNPNHIGNGS